jgi:hypothetical protein
LINKKFPAFSRMKRVPAKTKEVLEKSVTLTAKEQPQHSSVGVPNTSSSSSTAARQSLPVLPHQQQQQQAAISKPKGFSFLGSVSSLKNQQTAGQAATRGKVPGPTQQKPAGFSFLHKNDTTKQNADFIPFTSSLSTGIGRSSISSSSNTNSTGSGIGSGFVPNLIELEKMNKKKKKLEKK